MTELAKQAAIAEVLQPQLGTTEQFLAIHQLVMKDGVPIVLNVTTKDEIGVYCVYFQIVGERYYLMIVIVKEEEELVARSSYLEPAVRVYLHISSPLLAPTTISEKIKIQFTRSGNIGERINPRSPVKHKENRWYFEPQANLPGNLEDKLEYLLDQLAPSQPMIAALQKECNICIIICYEAYRGLMGGWHIEKATIQRVLALGADMDLDLYACGEHDLPDQLNYR
jgi:Domain of unknown function (DUF4279)